jgi:hypothetical protein
VPLCGKKPESYCDHIIGYVVCLILSPCIAVNTLGKCICPCIEFIKEEDEFSITRV